MSPADPTDHDSFDSQVPSYGFSGGLPVQDGQTANFSTPVQPSQTEPEADATMASGKPRREANRDQAKRTEDMESESVESKKSEPDGYGDRYERRGELGKGGWGVVERVHDRQLEREVAIKRITIPDDISQDAKDRFLHEAKITSQLQHPGVVPVHELVVGADQQSTYYVMKLLEGETLRDNIRKLHQVGKYKVSDAERTPPKSSYELVEQITPLLERFIDVCNAVAYAHQRGVIHRDLKPANIMVGAFGETIVVDWGLALKEYDRQQVEVCERTIAGGGSARKDNTSNFSETDGTVIGTPAYMSPEQARGEMLSLGSSSDIYSLGIVLWEIIAGRHPYRGQNVDSILEDVCAAKRPEINQQQPLVPKPLAAILSKALEGDPSGRYETATDLANDVRQFVLGEPVSVHEESLLDRTARWCRRNRSLVTMIAISTVALLLATLVFGYFINKARQAEQSAKLSAQAAHESALNSLVDARDAADSWLIDLSGSLEFYPGLESIRKQLLVDAIEQYESIVLAEVPVADLQSNTSVKLAAMTELEHVRCQLRLGDLYFLTEDVGKSKGQFKHASSRLTSLANSFPSSFTGDLTRPESVGIAEWIQLEKANSLLGLAFHDPSLIETSEFNRQRRWFAMIVPDDDELMESSIRSCGETAEFRMKAVSAAVRAELVAFRYGDVESKTARTIVRLKRAAQWARWLANVDSNSATQRLYQTTQQTLATFTSNNSEFEISNEAWETLVSDLSSWTEGVHPRPDQLQALAHARLMRLKRPVGRVDAEAQYRAAIKDLNLAWSLSDSDSFYRTNLANAELNLARTIVDGNALTEQQSTESRHLLQRALVTYQELLRDQVTIDRLRGLAQTHHWIAKLASDEEVKNHFDAAMLAYEMIHDHNGLEIEDAIDWWDLTAKFGDESAREKTRFLKQWLRDQQCSPDQAARLKELDRHVNPVD